MASGKGSVEAKTIRSLARRVGRAESTVRKWLRHEAWAFSLQGPWDVEKVKAWAEIQLKRDPGAAYKAKAKAADEGRGEFGGLGPAAKAKLQYTIERALAVRQRRRREAGQLHDVRECQHRRLAQIHALKGRLLELPRVMANTLAGADAETVERELAREIHGMLLEFAGEVGKTIDGDEEGENERIAR